MIRLELVNKFAKRLTKSLLLNVLLLNVFDQSFN
jgi:hypothetical protein